MTRSEDYLPAWPITAVFLAGYWFMDLSGWQVLTVGLFSLTHWLWSDTLIDWGWHHAAHTNERREP